MEMNIQNTCEFKNPVFERVFDGVTETPVTETVYVWGTDLSGSMQGSGGVGGLLAVKRGGVWYAPLYDANGHQKSAKPKGNPLGDRDFIAVPKGQSEERYPATQRQLYVTAYVSESGEVVAEYEYDAFGATISQSGMMADSFRHRFSTKPWIAALGVYDFGERLYSPKLRRWLSRDPIGEEGGVNLYSFCRNSPCAYIDCLGMKPEKPCERNRLPIVLVFDGKTLAATGFSTTAVSGKPIGITSTLFASDEKFLGVPIVIGKEINYRFDYSLDRQKIKNEGAIPEGRYWIEVDEVRNAITSPYSHIIKRAGWGDYSWSLHSENETLTHGRSGFFIHGGASWGSAGCIDIKGADIKLYSYLKGLCNCYIPVVVKYVYGAANVSEREPVTAQPFLQTPF